MTDASRGGILGLALGIMACGSDYVVEVQDPPTPRPPTEERSPYGEAPEWESCFEGYSAQYFNIPSGHAALEPPEGEDPIASVTDPRSLDLFDDAFLAFDTYEAALDPGPNWWPVDEGLEGDPAYFALRALTWVRVQEGLDWELRVGAADDFWLVVDRAVVVSRPGSGAFEPEVVSIPLRAGQYPVEVYFANRRAAASALTFRSLNLSGIEQCYPEFD